MVSFWHWSSPSFIRGWELSGKSTGKWIKRFKKELLSRVILAQCLGLWQSVRVPEASHHNEADILFLPPQTLTSDSPKQLCCCDFALGSGPLELCSTQSAVLRPCSVLVDGSAGDPG